MARADKPFEELLSRARTTRDAAWALARAGKVDAALSRLAPMVASFGAMSGSPELREPAVAQAALIALVDWVELAGFADVPLSDRFAILDRAEAMAAEAGRREWRSSLLGTRAALLRREGKLEEACELAREAVLHFRPDGTAYKLASHRQQYADILCELSRFDSAEIQFTAILAEPGVSPRDAKSALTGLARCALRVGRVAEALDHANRAVVVARELGDDASCNALGVLIDALVAARELPHATAVAEQLVERARRTGNATRLFFALRSHGDAATASGDKDAARNSLEEALRLAQQLDASVGKGERHAAPIRRRLTALG